ncbi:GrpB family protein [Rhizobium sp. 1399]|uniref:GrpB family protein n=1 Tax=Rhizobium sp. 1399 TaxID=2817758 RepID=UPI00286A38A3|nr:GrpB family protein [Rhizobium sp. 1399]
MSAECAYAAFRKVLDDRQSCGAQVAAIYHVGSTAVPGLSAKPEIILVEVSRPDVSRVGA